MARFELKIALGNDAMRTNVDVAAALREVADRIENYESCGSIRDANGNTVGSYAATEEGPALYDLPIFEWAWRGDAKDVER